MFVMIFFICFVIVGIGVVIIFDCYGCWVEGDKLKIDEVY